MKPDNRISTFAAFQEILDRSVNTHKLTGIQASILLPGQTVWNGAGGTIDPKRHELMTPYHVIRIGSITKTYTAVVILRLMERGVFSRSDTIDKWIPEYPHASRITIGMLLNHSSGIPELLGFRVMMISSLNSSKIWSPNELLSTIIGRKLDFNPGEDNRYSNSNYILLGIVAERATGKPLGALYHDEIFKPLNLKHTFFLPYDPSPPELVTGYDRSLIPLPGWHTTEPMNTAWSSCAYASGGMAATASDVLAFYNAIIDHTIVSPSSFAFMTQTSAAKHPKDKYLENFGSGLFCYREFFGNTYGHRGLFIGSEGIAIFSQDKTFIVVLLSNVSRIGDVDSIILEYIDMIKKYGTTCCPGN